ncbi:hypothetical protein ACFL6U_32805 [Planctomycetota bacterium]
MSVDNGHAEASKVVDIKQRKTQIAQRFFKRNVPKIKALPEKILDGDKSTFEEYEAPVGPVQAE